MTQLFVLVSTEPGKPGPAVTEEAPKPGQHRTRVRILPIEVKSAGNRIQRLLLLLVSVTVALTILFTPIQHYYPMARYQHYGLSLFACGLGFILQLIWFWKSSTLWARLSFLSGGLYLTSLGLIFYSFPWLDPRVTVLSGMQENYRALVGYAYTALSIMVAVIWVQGLLEELAAKKALQSRKDNQQ